MDESRQISVSSLFKIDLRSGALGYAHVDDMYGSGGLGGCASPCEGPPASFQRLRPPVPSHYTVVLSETTLVLDVHDAQTPVDRVR